MRKKIVIFGGSGFLGSHVADFLTKMKNHVIIFDKKNSEYLLPNQKFIKGNILDIQKVFEVTKRADYVFNFSGEADIENSKKNPLNTINSNIIGTTNILESCVKNKIKKYIHASTVYVNSEQGGLQIYKTCCELIIENYNEFFKLNYVIMRFGSLYGPELINLILFQSL